MAVFQHTKWTGFTADILIYHSANPKCINYHCIPLCMWVHCHGRDQRSRAILKLLQGKSTCIFLAVQPYLNPLTKPVLLISFLWDLLKWLQWNWPVTCIVQGSNKWKPKKKWTVFLFLDSYLHQVIFGGMVPSPSSFVASPQQGGPTFLCLHGKAIGREQSSD